VSESGWLPFVCGFDVMILSYMWLPAKRLFCVFQLACMCLQKDKVKDKDKDKDKDKVKVKVKVKDKDKDKVKTSPHLEK
jgi:hypothetical protein